LAELWNGAAWSISPAVNVAGSRHTELDGVSCSSTTACVAVGLSSYGKRNGTRPVIERWDGLSWSVQPTPPVSNGFLDAVSCVSVSACTAVGGRYSFFAALSSARGSALAERWNGASWSAQAMPPMPRHVSSEGLEGVSCPSTQACVAVGSTGTGGAVALGWNGLTWSSQLTLAGRYASGNPADLDTVSCATPEACVAGGTHVTKVVNVSGIWARWNGVTWTRPRSTTVRENGPMESVSCVAAIDCTAIAGADIEHWSGSTWSSKTVLDSFADTLQSISCASTTRCVAVGFRMSGNNAGRPLVGIGP
jgi:hypothetical protein